MTTNLVNEMVDIWVPDEEIVFEAGRKQQDQLFVESQTCDAFKNRAYLAGVPGKPVSFVGLSCPRLSSRSPDLQKPGIEVSALQPLPLSRGNDLLLTCLCFCSIGSVLFLSQVRSRFTNEI
jgi:hypothetical protein